MASAGASAASLAPPSGSAASAAGASVVSLAGAATASVAAAGAASAVAGEATAAVSTATGSAVTAPASGAMASDVGAGASNGASARGSVVAEGAMVATSAPERFVLWVSVAVGLESASGGPRAEVLSTSMVRGAGLVSAVPVDASAATGPAPARAGEAAGSAASDAEVWSLPASADATASTEGPEACSELPIAVVAVSAGAASSVSVSRAWSPTSVTSETSELSALSSTAEAEARWIAGAGTMPMDPAHEGGRLGRSDPARRCSRGARSSSSPQVVHSRCTDCAGGGRSPPSIRLTAAFPAVAPSSCRPVALRSAAPAGRASAGASLLSAWLAWAPTPPSCLGCACPFGPCWRPVDSSRPATGRARILAQCQRVADPPGGQTGRVGLSDRRLTGDQLASLSVLRLATAESASAYLAVAGALAAARERYEVQVRTEQVAEAVAPVGVAAEEVPGLLRQLREWKVVEAALDTARATRIEDFRRRRELWRLTPGGQAAVDAVAAVLGAAEEQGALHRSLLGQVRDRLEGLAIDVEAGEPDRVTAALRALDNDLRLLATGARDFHAALAGLRAETEADPERFLAFKERLLAHLESFVDELTRHRGGIAAAVDRAEAAAEAAGTSLASLAAAGDDATEVDGSEAVTARWQRRWDGLVGWFVGPERSSRAGRPRPERHTEAGKAVPERHTEAGKAVPERPTGAGGTRAGSGTRPAGADELRRATTQALRELVGLLRRLTEAEARPITRASELRHLAHWFLRLDTDDEAHALFDATIGLGRPTHLGVAAEDPEATPPGASWWTAPAVEVGITLRRTGQRAAPGNLFPLTSTSAQRARLAEAHERSAASRAAAATALLARPLAGRRLSPPERDLLLELLDRALHRRADPPASAAPERTPGKPTTSAVAQGVRLVLIPHAKGIDLLLPGGRLHLEATTLRVEAAPRATAAG